MARSQKPRKGKPNKGASRFIKQVFQTRQDNKKLINDVEGTLKIMKQAGDMTMVVLGGLNSYLRHTYHPEEDNPLYTLFFGENEIALDKDTLEQVELEIYGLVKNK